MFFHNASSSHVRLPHLENQADGENNGYPEDNQEGTKGIGISEIVIHKCGLINVHGQVDGFVAGPAAGSHHNDIQLLNHAGSRQNHRSADGIFQQGDYHIQVNL